MFKKCNEKSEKWVYIPMKFVKFIYVQILLGMTLICFLEVVCLLIYMQQNPLWRHMWVFLMDDVLSCSFSCFHLYIIVGFIHSLYTLYFKHLDKLLFIMFRYVFQPIFICHLISVSWVLNVITSLSRYIPLTFFCCCQI